MKSLQVSLSFAAFLILSVNGQGIYSDQNCSTIAQIICENEYDNPLIATDTLCDAIKLAGLEDDLSEEDWTIFAPTNEAFDTLPEEYKNSLLGLAIGDGSNSGRDNIDDNMRAIIDLLAFHAVPGEALNGTDLSCDGRLFMADEEASITVCEGDRTYQVGMGNLATKWPEIIITGVEACNGIVHVISEVMLYESITSNSMASISPSNSPTQIGSDSVVTLGPTNVDPRKTPSPVSSPTPSPVSFFFPSPISPGSTAPSSAAPSDSSSSFPSSTTSISADITVSLTSAPTTVRTEPCSITEIACESDEFTLLCAAIKATGLDELFDDYNNGSYTVFAPTDKAFENLGEVAVAYLFDPVNVNLLANILSFHTIGGKVIYSQDLKCMDTIEMLNGWDSRTVCRQQGMYQKGNGNSMFDKPEIIETDIESCSGIIHVVDGIMMYKNVTELGIPAKDATFPPASAPITPSQLSPAPVSTRPPSKDFVAAIIPTESPVTKTCKTIDEVICSDTDFSILCGSLRSTGLDGALRTGTWTLFAPTNDAFLKLPPSYVQTLTKNPGILSRLLLFHTVAEQALYKSDLPCDAGLNLIPMTNGKDSRTLCMDTSPGVPVPLYQKGNFNNADNPPEIVYFDMNACNGVIHELDAVMLFRPVVMGSTTDSAAEETSTLKSFEALLP